MTSTSQLDSTPIQPREAPILLSALPVTASHRRTAVFASLALLTALVICAPFARIRLAPLPAFIAFQQAVLLTNDLITAVLLFAQYRVQRPRGLNVLAGGYLFTALIVIPHALSYPGVISATGLFGAGSQTAAWLYIAWRTVFPLTMIAYSLLRDREYAADHARQSGLGETLAAIIAAVGGVIAVVLLTIVGRDWLPPLMNGNLFGTGARIAVGATLALTLCALLVLFIRRQRSVLDLWLTVVMFAWLCADIVGSFISGGRFDVGYYAGRIYSVLASSFVLLVLLYEMTALYARVIHASRVERRQREHRMKEMEALLAEKERAAQLTLAAKHAAEEANRAKSEFLAGISHEIRTPMACVIGMTDQLLSGNLTAQQRHYAELVRDASQSLVIIIDDLLDLSKIEAGKLELRRVPLRPSAVAEGALAIVRPGAEAKSLVLRAELATDLPAWIEGDPTRLRQILLNLLSNAVKFTKRGSIVLKMTRQPGAMRLRFEVADTGIGIAPAEQGLLFQRFARLGPPGGREPGTGLGLAISRQLVEAMGGSIGVTSRVGEGSVFWFTIPFKEIPTPAKMQTPVAEQGGRPRCRILVAEDHDLIRQLVETVLTDAGHEVVLVQNGDEAINALIEDSDYDLILMDVSMPVMDGITAMRLIRQMGDHIRNIPVIALTAYGMSEDIDMIRGAGASDHLTKPIKRDELLRAVAKWSGDGVVKEGAGSAKRVTVIDTSQ
jgi:two-component system, sensor histidine kinase and response regulator